MPTNAINGTQNPSLQFNDRFLVVDRSSYDLEGFELIGKDEVRDAVAQGIGEATAYNAKVAETYGRFVFQNCLTVMSFLCLNAVVPAATPVTGAVEGAMAEKFSASITNTFVGRGLTWLTGKGLKGATAGVTSAYLTARAYSGNGTTPSPLAIGYAAYNYNTPAAVVVN